ncbi:DUF397 domain-containing protein [Streptomyces coelicoflavus]|uniref:DUF397 domain-containing protein n=1 Tax=Streptomyces coelicoflavus TaxID=285562 RepID=UPI002E259096
MDAHSAHTVLPGPPDRGCRPQRAATLEKEAVELLAYDTHVIAAGTRAVLVRDSKAVPGPLIRVSREAWAGFIGR